MKAALAILFVMLAVMLASASAFFGNDYCDDSDFDPRMVTAGEFFRQKGLFLAAYSRFRQLTYNANLTSDADLTTVALALRDVVEQYRNYDANIQGFTITRSSGIIIIDTPSEPPINPPIENHNTRYEYAHAIQCRDKGAPVIFEKYYIPRLQRSLQFFAKAIQTGLDGTWFVFRINFFALPRN